MNRRHLLAGAAALPVAGLVGPAAAASEDPAVAAFHVWRVAWKSHEAFCCLQDDWADGDPEENRLNATAR